MQRSGVDIYGLVDDISRHDTAAPLILAAGAGSVPALSRYLDESPSSVPHARLFAIAMLDLIPGVEATVALRRALHRHDLHTLAPAVADSEWLVQNAAFAALAKRLGPAIAMETDYGLNEARLRAAADAVGQFALEAYIPALIEALADDILGEPARRAVTRFGAAAVPHLIKTLDHHDSDVAALNRAIAAADILGQLSCDEAVHPLLNLLSGVHPALFATAALALVNLRADATSPALATALTCGALLPDALLADRCLDVLDTLPPRTLRDAAADALAMGYLPDFYGVPYPVSDTARARLLASLLRRSDVNATRIIERTTEKMLLRALRQLDTLPAGPNAETLQQHPDPLIREAAARIAARGKR
ncbi:MAG: hypothetical protein ACRES9_06070 [Gammaproteobacteria bacterium]